MRKEANLKLHFLNNKPILRGESVNTGDMISVYVEHYDVFWEGYGDGPDSILFFQKGDELLEIYGTEQEYYGLWPNDLKDKYWRA